MAVLRTLLAFVVPACYSPDIRDCTVSCTQPGDCAPSQVCGSDGFCAAQTVAGTCAKIASTDASIDSSPPRDGAPQLDAMPDAPELVKLWVRIDGRGVVNIPTVGTCDGSPGEALCPFDVPRGALLTLNAQPKNNWQFDRWQDACDGAPTPTCVLAPEEDTQARVRFELNDDLL